MTSRFEDTEKTIRMPDAQLEKFGDYYRRLCAQQGADVLVLIRANRRITFEQFVAHQNFAEAYRSRRRAA